MCMVWPYGVYVYGRHPIFDAEIRRGKKKEDRRRKHMSASSMQKLIRRWDGERELYYYDIFNHIYAMRPVSYRIRLNNAK